MIAIDTNVVVRYLTNDHPRQSGAARTPISENAVFLSRTVILECEWVLRCVYGFSPPEVCKALRAFAGLPKISIEDLGMVVRALDLAGHGFRRRTSLAAAGHCEAFATFDQAFVKRAKQAGLDKVRSP